MRTSRPTFGQVHDSDTLGLAPLGESILLQQTTYGTAAPVYIDSIPAEHIAQVSIH